VIHSLRASPGFAQANIETIPHVKPRLVVLTDLANEPDDEQSLVRLLVQCGRKTGRVLARASGSPVPVTVEPTELRRAAATLLGRASREQERGVLESAQKLMRARQLGLVRHGNRKELVDRFCSFGYSSIEEPNTRNRI
jgi:hypothetical protein